MACFIAKVGAQFLAWLGQLFPQRRADELASLRETLSLEYDRIDQYAKVVPVLLDTIARLEEEVRETSIPRAALRAILIARGGYTVVSEQDWDAACDGKAVVFKVGRLKPERGDAAVYIKLEELPESREVAYEP